MDGSSVAIEEKDPFEGWGTPPPKGPLPSRPRKVRRNMPPLEEQIKGVRAGLHPEANPEAFQKTKPVNLNTKTRDLMEAEGYTGQIVEHYNNFSGKKNDFFGCIDWLGVNPKIPGVLGVQITTDHNASARMKKAKAEPRLRAWLQSGNRFEVHGWKKDERGRWMCVKRPLALADLGNANFKERYSLWK